MRVVKAAICLALLACLAVSHAAQAATEVDWVSSLPGVSVTVSSDKGSALSRVYAVSDVDATYAAVKQGLTKRGWTVQDAASTVVTGASVHALVATREGRRLSVSVQAATGVSPTMSLHLNRAVGQAPAHTGGHVTTSTVAAQPSLTVNDGGVTGTYTVNGHVIVNGSGCTLTIGGDVTRLIVNGSSNTVTITGSVSRIILNGSVNQVHWPSSSHPKVTDNGGGNAASSR